MRPEAERVYTKIPEAAFCPRCHRRVQLPSFLKTARIGGSIRVSCGCKKGVVVIKGNMQPQIEEAVS